MKNETPRGEARPVVADKPKRRSPKRLRLEILGLPDPVVAVMKKNRGRLCKDHKLDY